MDISIKGIRTGAILAILAALTFSIMNVLTKKVASTLPSSEIVFYRSLFSTIIISASMLYNKVSFRGGNVPLLVARGVLGGVGLLGVFYTIAHIKLADASILLQLNPVFVIMFAAFFLKERVPRVYIPVLTIALIGCLFIIRPSLDSFSFPAVVGVGAAILAAGAYTCIRALSRDHHTSLIVFYFVVTAMIVSAPVMLPVYVAPTAFEFLILFGIGATSSAAQIFLTKAYRLEKAGTVAILSYSGIFFHILWGYLFWGETLDFFSMMGGVLIVGACMTLTIYKNNKKED